MYKFVLLFFFVALISNCKKDDSTVIIPSCIEQKIQIFELDACKPGASVNEYLFQNEIVYTFDPGNCIADSASEVYTDDCELLGILGGIAGFEDINGVNFSKNATLIKLVWKN